MSQTLKREQRLKLKQKTAFQSLSGVLALFFQQEALASSDLPVFIDYYHELATWLGLELVYAPLLASGLVLFLCFVAGLMFKSSVERSLALEIQLGSKAAFTPSRAISLPNFVEAAMDFLYSLSKEHCGASYLKYFPLLSGLFLFILVSNLSGLVPGLPPATENFSINVALGLIAFLAYNYAGLCEHGAHYIKQFCGPFLVLAPLFLVIELVSHAVRPASLAFRLLANVFCDHLLLGVFSGLVPLVVPSLFLFFGLLVAFIQSFVFTLLTGIYINMAVSHDH